MQVYLQMPGQHGAIDSHPIRLEFHYKTVTKCNIFRFVMVEEGPLPEPQGLEAAQYYLLLPIERFGNLKYTGWWGLSGTCLFAVAIAEILA